MVVKSAWHAWQRRCSVYSSSVDMESGWTTWTTSGLWARRAEWPYDPPLTEDGVRRRQVRQEREIQSDRWRWGGRPGFSSQCIVVCMLSWVKSRLNRSVELHTKFKRVPVGWCCKSVHKWMVRVLSCSVNWEIPLRSVAALHAAAAVVCLCLHYILHLSHDQLLT